MMAGNALETKTEQPSWEAVLDLLAAGKYESAATLLEKTEAASSNEADLAVKSILRATREMCLAGNDYRAQAEFHKQAFHTASVRENQLREHLQVLLSLITSRRMTSEQVNGSMLPLLPTIELLQTNRQIPGLLKRLQNLLGQSAAPASDVNEQRHSLLRGEGRNSDPDRAGPAIAVHCLGSFAVYQNDQLITDWNGLKGLTILKYLVAQGGKPVSKDVLMEVLWPNGDPEAARRNLHQAIYSLRQAMRQHEPDFQHVLFHNDAYHFNPDLALWIDFVQFERYSRLGQQHAEIGHMEEAMSAYGVAEELYQGDFLEEDLYEEWAIAQRERLRTTYLRIADQMAAYYVQRQNYVAATAIAQKALRHDPYYEAAHRWLMRCYMGQGQRHLAVRQYQICADLLADELELQPSPETIGLYEQIRAAE